MLGVPAPSFPAKMSQQRQGNSRNKVALRPGRSLMDWIKLTKDGGDLQGFRGRIRPVTLDELACHKTENDCWMAIRGQVYNVSHYMEYHPGGVDELMKGAGKDATELFEGVHKWVNFSSMLAKCYIGPLKYENKLKNMMKKVPSSTKQNTFLVPTIPSLLKDYLPRYEWYEKGMQLVLSVYIKQPFYSSDIIVDCDDGKILDMKVLFSEKFYRIHLELEHSIDEMRIISVTDKKIEMTLDKEDQMLKWSNLGTALEGHNILKLNNERELKFRNCQLISIEEVTHNTKLYTIELPKNCYYESPIGHHIKFKVDFNGVEVQRSYTVVLPSFDSTVITNFRTGKLLHFMIKHYDTGVLTPILNSLEKGCMICMSDCIGTFKRSILNDKSKIYLIAAGTGLTPMIRLIDYYLNSTITTSQVKLLFANNKYKDILWRNLIDDEVKKFPSRFHCTYILSEPNTSWTGLSGRISKEVLQMFITENPFLIETELDVPPLAKITPIIDTGEMFAVCGPDDFTLSIERMLLDIGITDSNIHCFLG